MRLFITILICKLSRLVLKAVGRGSSMPGKIALKLYPDVLYRIKLPKYIIAVTGSNGKTSTVEMIHEVLNKANISYAYNQEGSNQIDGVTTLILNNCDYHGNFLKDVLLLESDERYAQYSFKYFSPTHYVITNIYRDQMTRNGNPEFVLNEIRKSISGSVLILNCDDPLISSLANDNEVVYFGINDTKYAKKDNDYLYNDGYYCPVCQQKLEYDYHQFGHIGKYKCSNCSFKRNDPKYYVSDINYVESEISINDVYKINIALRSTHNVYNVLSAFSVCKEIGIDEKIIVDSLNNYLIKNGRVKTFEVGNKKGTLLISKHENSVSYNQNIRYVIDNNEDISVVIIVDAVSRKYFTSETSWLWDINFELLASDKVKKIIISGLYAYDLATRLKYSDIDFNKVYINTSISEAVNYLKENTIGYIYTLTCFSDEAKFIKEVNLT